MSDSERHDTSNEVVNPLLLKSLFLPLNWNCRLQVYSFLTLSELKQFGLTCKTALVLFERERGARKCVKSKIDFSKFLKKGDVTSDEVIRTSSESDCNRRTNGRIVLVSYPRSGNSLIRTLLESHSGVYTGSDNRPNRPLALNLLQMGGFYGEGIADDSVWIVKSHYPERVGYLPIDASVVVMIVRNPFDAISSYFQMGMTNSHNKTLTEESMRILRTVWDDFIKNEVSIWNRFHEYWLEVCESVGGEGHIPVYMLRYEDLLHDQKNTMEKLMTFLAPYYPTRLRADHRSTNSGSSLTAESLLSMYSFMSLSQNDPPTGQTVRCKGQKEISKKEQREQYEREEALREQLQKEKSQNVIVTDSKSAGYVPRQGGIGKSLSHMTSKQVLYIQKNCQRLLWKFGYDITQIKNTNKSARKKSESNNVPESIKQPSIISLKNDIINKKKSRKELKEERLLEISEDKRNKRNKHEKSDTFEKSEKKTKRERQMEEDRINKLKSQFVPEAIANEHTHDTEIKKAIEDSKQYYKIDVIESTYMTQKNEELLIAAKNSITNPSVFNSTVQQYNTLTINPMTREVLNKHFNAKSIKSLLSGIRLDSDVYGRNISDLRYMYTNNDKTPLEIMESKK